MFIRVKHMMVVGLFAVVAAAGVGGCSADLGDCPTDSAAAQSAGQTIVNSKCATAGCHNGNNAAEGLDFNDTAVVSANKETMYAEVVEGAMPPSGALSDADMESVRVYLACLK